MAFSPKTLRAAGLLPVAGVGSFLTARCGALRAAKAALATAKIPRRSAPRSFQTGSKMLMARPFNCGSRNAEFNAALIPALRAATVSPRRRSIARPRRNAERGLGNRAVIATFLHFFRQIAYRGLGTARGLW